MEFTRRNFVGRAGALTVGAVVAVNGAKLAVAEEAAASELPPELEAMYGPVDGPGMDLPWSGPGSADGSWTGSPADLAARGGSNMPLDELNRRRRMYIDAQTEYVKEDGTVVPASLVKMRALMNTLDYGMGYDLHDDAFDYYWEITEDEAQAYIEMPLGRLFTPYDYSVESGRPVEECEEYLQRLYDKGFMVKTQRGADTMWSHITFSPFQMNIRSSGNFGTYEHGWIPNVPYGTQYDDEAYDMNGTPWEVPFVASREAIKDGEEIYPYDDIEALLRRQTKIVLGPCPCRGMLGIGLQFNKLDNWPEDPMALADIIVPSETHPDGYHLETCMTLGDVADTVLELGSGREISVEEAIEIYHRSLDEGLVPEHSYGKRCESVCFCAGETCVAINGWKAMADKKSLTQNMAYQQVSHYTLEVDLDKCIQCGICQTRCQCDAITMDGEYDGKGGYPQVGETCFRCGLCALTCPVEARKLVPIPQELIHPLPADIWEDQNEKAAYRFEHGLIR